MLGILPIFPFAIHHCWMQFSDEDLKEFIESWRIAFGEVLTIDQARHHARRLMALYAQLSRPLPEANKMQDHDSNP